MRDGLLQAAGIVLPLFFIAAIGVSPLWLLSTGVAAWASYSAWQAGLMGQAWGYLAATVAGSIGLVMAVMRVGARSKERAIPVPQVRESAPIQRPQAPAQPAAQAQPAEAPPVRLKPLAGPGFAGVAGMADLKAKLMEAATEAIKKSSTQQRNGILLHGAPGNGKTYMVEALAQELRVPLVTMTFSDVGSRWMGAGKENVMERVKLAKANAPCVLFLDEADSLLERRSSGDEIGGGSRDLDRTTNVLLTETVNLRGSGVVIVAATNFIDKLDPAAIREGRFDFKIEITPPDEPARVALLEGGLKKHARDVRVPQEVILSAAKRWKGFSVKRILAVAEQVPTYARRNGKRTLTFDDLRAVLREVQGAKRQPPEGTKNLEDLVLTADLRASLRELAMRLEKAFEIEQAGGSIPTGLLFSGPPGTGKTETAKALAKASGYAFLAYAGNDLIGDPRKIEQAHREAMDLRPAILFIDEADDLLADRAHSPYKSATNKLLTVMDGAGYGRIPDILYIAATNHPEDMDSAALRGGRFSEKVEFVAPDTAAMTPWIERWLRGKGWDSELASYEIAALLEGQPMSNVAEVMQQAVNAAITGSGNFDARRISKANIERAIRKVIG